MPEIGEKRQREEGEQTLDDRSKVARMEPGRISCAPPPSAAPTAQQSLEQMAQQYAASEQIRVKRLKELFIGNLNVERVNDTEIINFFTGLLRHIPEFVARYSSCGPPVTNIRMSMDRKYAFVEFIDEYLANTCSKFDKADFLGRPINIGRPKEYVAPSNLPSMDVTVLEQLGLLTLSAAAMGKPPQGEKVKRELYLGQLPAGASADTLKTELQKVLTRYALPDECPPVIDIRLAPNGKYAFAELRSVRLTAQVLASLPSFNVQGRDVTLGRPVRSDGTQRTGGTLTTGKPSAMDEQVMYAQYAQMYTQAALQQAALAQQMPAMGYDQQAYWAQVQYYMAQQHLMANQGGQSTTAAAQAIAQSQPPPPPPASK